MLVSTHHMDEAMQADHGRRHILLAGRTLHMLSLHPDMARDELAAAGIAARVRLALRRWTRRWSR